MLKKMCLAAALALSVAAGKAAYADDQNLPEKNIPVEVSKRFELNDELDLRIFGGNGLNSFVMKDGRTTQNRLGADLELKLDGKLSKFVPYVRGEVNSFGYDLDLPFPEVDRGRYMSVGGGVGLKFKLYEGKEWGITLKAGCGYDSMMGKHCGGGIGGEW